MIHRDLFIISAEKDSRDLVAKIHYFAKCHSDYTPLPNQTDRYREAINADAYVLHAIYKDPFPSISLATSDGASLQIANIVPKTKGALTINEYNEFVIHFAKALSAFSRARRLGLRVKLTCDELTLESAITGAKTREWFERYLAQHPTSYHYHDIRRLDHFICAASRNKRGRVDIDRLCRYLMEKLAWSSEDAKWCANRIRIGLEVLEASRE